MKRNPASYSVLAAAGLMLLLCGCGRDTRQAAVRHAKPSAESVKPSDAKNDPAKRPFYRYSVVPGGVYTPQEARERAAGDPVVARHYEGIDTARLRPVVNDQDRDVYVSYRVGNQVYWTRQPVRLRRNEVVLSDGQQEIRTRCGNRISLVPMGPVHLDAEPNADVFDTKVAEADTVWPEAVMTAQATPLGGVLTSVPLMPNWMSNEVGPPSYVLPPGLMPTSPPPPAGGGGGLPGGGGGTGGGGGIVPIGTDGATYFNSWGGSVGSGLVLVNQVGSTGNTGGMIINNVEGILKTV